MIKDVFIDGAILSVAHFIIAEGRPTIVFLHDSLGSIELWRDFPLTLGEMTNCNVLMYDRQGYGKPSPFISMERSNDYLEKESSVLIKVLENLGLKKVILFGHSDGGSIALITAAKYPDVVSGIVTEGAHIFVEDITLNGIKEAVKAYEATNLKERLQKYHGQKTDHVFYVWVNTWLKDEYRAWSIESFLPHIICPVLVIQGTEDQYGSDAQVDGIVNQVFGKAVKLVIPSVGHTPHKEARETVLQELVSFIHRHL